ncbi:hypothetical protein [Ruminococcus sp. 5_1_39BFAA]|uniref:hypothetical protein n=1 Tax=Ruminococcus sp. 5_1_39BFAA TaxID=457412 RepID=UPI003561AF82
MINWNEMIEAQVMYETMDFEYSERNLELIGKFIREKEKNLSDNGRSMYENISNKMFDYIGEYMRRNKVYIDLFFLEYAEPFHNAVNKAVDEEIQYKFPIPITSGEWNRIKEIGNEEIERLMFTMLILAKYRNIVRQRRRKEDFAKPYRVELEDAKIRKLANVKVHRGNQASKSNYRDYLKENGYITISERNQIFVMIADEDSEVIETITDYDHLYLHYERLNGAKIGTCKKCGRLFRQNKQNNLTQCEECRAYKPKEAKKVKCIDCDEIFIKKPSEKRKCRCDKCQKIHALELKRVRNRRYIEKKA